LGKEDLLNQLFEKTQDFYNSIEKSYISVMSPYKNIKKKANSHTL